MQIRSLTFIVICLFFAVPALSQHYYAPEENYLLALNDKNDLNGSFSANASTVGKNWNTNYQFQVGYSPREHFAVAGNFFKLRQMPDSESATPKSFETHFGSIALGTYFYMKKKKMNSAAQAPVSIPNRLVLFDFYTGYGLGNSSRAYDTNRHSRFYFQKFFVQGGAHLNEKRIGFSTVLRYNLLDFNRGKVFGKLTETDLRTQGYLKEKNPHHVLELTFRFSAKITKNLRLFYSKVTVLNSALLYEKTTNHFGLLLEIDQVSKPLK